MYFKSARVWIWGGIALIGTAALVALPLFAVQDDVARETDASATEALLVLWVMVTGAAGAMSAIVVLILARGAAVRRRRVDRGSPRVS